MITMIVRYGKINADVTPIAKSANSGATMFGDTEKVCTFLIGMRLTTSSDTPTSQSETTQFAHSVVHQWPGNCSLAAMGPIAPTAPAGAGIPTKQFLAYAGCSRSS